jgi:uncharacterized protein with FMN-binding domain
MKRALLIAGGTVGGLGAVLVITPPNLSKTAPIAVDTAAQSFTGVEVGTRYGPVQVKIMVKNGKIVDAQTVQAPTGSSDRYTQMSVPVLRERTIAAQSANVQAVSGASFTSYGWSQSLASAIAQAGL